MAVSVAPQVDLLLDTPLDPVQPEGSTLVSAYAFEPFFSAMQPGDPVSTLKLEMFSPSQLGEADFRNMAQSITQSMVNAVPVEQGGEEVVLYYAYEEVIFDVSIPTNMCLATLCYDLPASICVPFTDWCLPLAGQTLAAAYRYTFWALLRETVVFGPPIPPPPGGGGSWYMIKPAVAQRGFVEARPFLWGIPIIWLVIIGILAAVGIAVIVYSTTHGKTTFVGPKNAVTPMPNPSGTTITKPGQNAPPITVVPPSALPPVNTVPMPQPGQPGLAPAASGGTDIIMPLVGGVLLAGALAFFVSSRGQE